LRLRDAAGLTQPDAARTLSATPAKIAKMERGWVPVRDPDLHALCQLYKASARQVSALQELARADRERRKASGWWRQYPELGQVAEYVSLEEVATRVRTWQTAFVPGLFQTPDYAKALAVGNGDWSNREEIERFVEARVARQARLSGADPIEICAIVSEAVVRHMVGGRQVMRAQLDRLAEVSRLPNVTMRVLPFESGAHPGMTSAFNILSFAETGALEVVHLDTNSYSLWLESEADALRHGVLFERIAEQALSQSASVSMIERVSREM
jgi:hypothetical protein